MKTAKKTVIPSPAAKKQSRPKIRNKNEPTPQGQDDLEQGGPSAAQASTPPPSAEAQDNGGDIGTPAQCLDIEVAAPDESGTGMYQLHGLETDDTEISWTHRTVNWWMGCTKVSPGCRECYAEKDCKRQGRPVWGPNAPRPPVAGAEQETRNCNKAAGEMGCKDTVFCCSLSDFFEDRPDLNLDELRAKAWKVIKECENLIFIILTKRPENIARMLPPDWGDEGYPNVCLAATVENGTEKVMKRIDALRAVPAPWRMLSAEPLLGPIDLRGRLDGIHFVIAGGETGNTADPNVTRPMHPDWARAIRDACQEADVAFFFKQWGSWSMSRPSGVENPTVVDWQGFALYFTGNSREKMAPPLLDGREWHDHPFGPDVDLARPSAYSRIKMEAAAARSLKYQDPDSKAEFERLNRAVLTGCAAAFEVGRSLTEIRDRKLWRAGGYHSWDAYCATLGEVSRAYADRLISAVGIRDQLAEDPPIGADGQPVLPLNELQVRYLAKLPDAATRNEVWHRAVAKNNGGVPTGKVVKDVVIDVLATVVDQPSDSKPEVCQAQTSSEEGMDDSHDRRMVVHTIGFAGKSAERFFGLLHENEVRRVIDVRLSNTNQLAGFTKRDDLEFFLREIVDLDYHWLKELAPTDEIRDTTDWEVYQKSFHELLDERDVGNRVDPNLIDGCCLLCSEHEPDKCHRRLVAEYLRDRWSRRGISLEINHLN